MSFRVITLFVPVVIVAAMHRPASAGEKDGVHVRFALAGLGTTDRPVTVTVSGKITDAKTSQPIAGAVVRGHIVVWRYQGPDLFDKCPHQETTAGPDGTYRLTFVTPLTIWGPMKGKDGICVDACAPGYETKPQYVRPDVTPEKTDFTNVDIALGPGKLITGKVVDADNQPIDGAIVAIGQGLNGDWNFFASVGRTTTAATGDFEIRCSTDPNTVGDRPWLRISKPGYGVGFFWDIRKKGTMGTLVVPRGGALSGRVVGTNGKGIAACEVSVRDSFGLPIDKTLTDNEGQYQLAGIPGEETLTEFFKAKNGTFQKKWAEVTVYARPDAQMNLRDVPQYKITAKDGKTVSAPGLIVGAEASVAGSLVASQPAYGLKGLMVRLDYDWGHMVEADADGKFRFPYVQPGKHRLTAYLPMNLRGDRGIGSTEVEVQAGKALDDVAIQLVALAEVRVQILDTNGNPLEGVTAGATWTPNGEGFWTEGTRSDKDGRSVLYLYAGQVQYIRGFDTSERSLVAEGFEKVEPKAGQVIENVRITMVSPATIHGRVMMPDGKPLAGKRLVGRLAYADKAERVQAIKTDADGRFSIGKLVPGIVSLTIDTRPMELTGSTASPAEIKPGEDKDVGDVTLNQITFYRVSGRLVASPTFSSLAGFKIRVDLDDWQPMLPTDAEGGFILPKVPAGKHRLTAYLPFNLRMDRGVGHVEIDVKDKDLANVELPLETLATVHMRIEDESGKPIKGIAAAAWWTKDHSGVFTEGSKSDENGKATLYLYPDDLQYVGAHDWDGKYRLKAHTEMTLKAGEVVDDARAVMAPN